MAAGDDDGIIIRRHHNVANTDSEVDTTAVVLRGLLANLSGVIIVDTAQANLLASLNTLCS